MPEVQEYVSSNLSDTVTMLVYHADWCVSCKELELFTFSDTEVMQYMQPLRIAYVDVTDNDENTADLLKAFNLFGPPALLFFDKNGAEIPAARIVGFISAAKFTKHLQELSKL